MGFNMNIKSLLLGSATAFAVVSGANAADAIVAAAPEPMEYVKVCDAFGTGYFYIPGTETCLKISGMIQWNLDYGNGNNAPLFNGATNSGYKWSSYNNSQFRLNIEAKNDSEVGTVYSLIHFRAYNGATTGTGVNTGTGYNGIKTWFDAGIDAGAVGFEVGYNETPWVRFFNYGGFTDNGGLYDYTVRSYAEFFGKTGAFSYMASVEDLTANAGKTAGLNAGAKATFGNYEGALGFDYDIASKSFGVKGYVFAKFDPVKLQLKGYYNRKADSAYSPTKLSGAGIQGAILIASGQVDITDRAFVAVDYSYAFTPKYWEVAGNVGYHIAKGFDTMVEARYDKDKTSGGFLRFERNF
jgi:hypothetical protein